jgi:hypothetical protein
MAPIAPLPLRPAAKLALRLPLALLWATGGMARRTAESLFWGPALPDGDACPPRPGRHPAPHGCATRHVYRIACEPPCYGCGTGCDGGRHG